MLHIWREDCVKSGCVWERFVCSTACKRFDAMSEDTLDGDGKLVAVPVSEDPADREEG